MLLYDIKNENPEEFPPIYEIVYFNNSQISFEVTSSVLASLNLHLFEDLSKPLLFIMCSIINVTLHPCI